MNDDPLKNMRARAEQWRRLADLTHDRRMADQLREWAEEIKGKPAPWKLSAAGLLAPMQHP